MDGNRFAEITAQNTDTDTSLCYTQYRIDCVEDTIFRKMTKIDARPIRFFIAGVGLLFCLALLFIAGATLSPVLAQETEEVTANEVNEVARQLWCPLCSGVRLDSCDLAACIQMKEVIAVKLAEGEDAESIKAYFLDYYGPQILGEPPREGFNWLAWLLPPLALLGGGIFVWMRTRRMVQQSETTSAAAPMVPTDEDERKLEEELKRYD